MQWVRVVEDRDPSPSAASLDSQSVSTAVMVHEAVGFDAGKKIKGRKRFTLVDTRLLADCRPSSRSERAGTRRR